MTASTSLQSFCLREEGKKSFLNHLDRETYAFLKGQPISLEEILDSRELWQMPLSHDKIVQNWKTLFHVALLATLSHSNLNAVSHQVHLFLRQPWNQQSQYLRVLVALCQHLVGLPSLEVSPHLLQNGAAPLEMNEYCPWQAVPYIPYHAEFGVLLSLLAQLTKREDLQAEASRLAKWQLNVLGTDYIPLNGLFTQEKDGQLSLHLLWNYLLFKSVKSFEDVSEAQFKYITNLTVGEIPLLFPLLEKIIQNQGRKEEEILLEGALSEQIYDPSTSLVGHRDQNQHAVCTLHGGHTGLGSFRSHDVQIINYGPQYLPLGECRGFGIEGNYLTDHGIRKSTIQLHPKGFSLKGCVRLVDEPSVHSSSFDMGQFRGIWLETEQEYQHPQLNIKTQFLGFNGWDEVAFSFYVKAQKCSLNASTVIHPRTLGRYEGIAQPITLEGQAGSIKINSSLVGGNMQVIPLSGEASFWGADFLIAYLLDSKERHYQWNIN